LGVTVWGGTYVGQGLAQSSDGSTNRNLLGAGLAAAVTVVGYLLVIVVRHGALATAGVVAAGIGVPLTALFLTFDLTSSKAANWDAIFWVSVVIWAVSYLVVPGARGHTFFVFLVANSVFDYVLIKNTDNLTANLGGSGGLHVGGLGTIAAIGLLFGLGYYLIAFLLDRAGRHGPATGLVYPAFNATTGGIVAWSPDVHLIGAGAITIVVGILVCWYGGRYGRRITCFVGAAGIALGIGLLVYDAAPSGGVTAGVTFLLVGAAVVVVAALLARALREPHDMDAEAVVVGSR